ncbi:hypothetical protein [Rubripirellula obstinata]|uniref:hypothetical protein n=1 Tax=Rubripirellula obstinata TaxID=406547 RepID=UPI001357AFED|nr:hypothetical protein [Rubripirellula obstinata]
MLTATDGPLGHLPLFFSCRLVAVEALQGTDGPFGGPFDVLATNVAASAERLPMDSN